MNTNYKVVLEYDGREFSGWQRQLSHRSVQGEVEAALFALTGNAHVVHGAGRTDAGAHALGQVANFRLLGTIPATRLLRALNSQLPSDVAVLSVELVDDRFHARFSARRRWYRYRWFDREVRSPVERGRSWHLPHRLDDGRMALAAGCLVGRHDWTTFCSASEPVDARVREVFSARVTRIHATAGDGNDLVELVLSGDGFLRGQIRGIAGGLAEVGLGRRPVDWFMGALAAADRRLAPRTAPACGLTLVSVEY